MHDCQRCQTPLHGHEFYCPVCGLKQYVRPENQANDLKQYMRPGNPLIIILITLVGGVLLFFAVQNSWIGQLAKRGPEPEEEMLSPQSARAKIESVIMQNLAQQSASGKFSYTADDKPVDINYSGAVNLTIETNLKHPEQRKSIVEPVKSFMAPANINVLTLNDEHSHDTVTLTLPPEPAANTTDTNADNSGSQ